MSNVRITGRFPVLEATGLLLCALFFGPQAALYLLLGYLCLIALALLVVLGLIAVTSSPMRRFGNSLKGLLVKPFKFECRTITKRAELPAHLKARVADLNKHHKRLKESDPALASAITDLSVAVVVCFKVSRATLLTREIAADLERISELLSCCNPLRVGDSRLERSMAARYIRTCTKYLKLLSEESAVAPTADPTTPTAVVPADLLTMFTDLKTDYHSLGDEELSIQLRDAIIETEYFAKHFTAQAVEGNLMVQLKLIHGLLANCLLAKSSPAGLAEVVKYDVLQQQALASVIAYRQIVAAQLTASMKELHDHSNDAADSIQSMAAASQEVHMHR